MRQRSARDCGMLRPVVHPPVIFLPRHLAGIRDQILAADVVMPPQYYSVPTNIVQHTRAITGIAARNPQPKLLHLLPWGRP